jgi:GT2 family glycosyltransferase
LKILFLAVNYGTSDHARSFQQQFARAKVEHRALLVDNTDGADKGKLEQELPRDRPDFRCVTAPDNLGYFGGMRHGIDLSFARDYRADWTVISNVDVHFDPDAIATALRDLDPDSVACVAPSIVSDLTGIDLNPYMERRPPALRMRIYKQLFNYYWGLVIWTQVSDWLVRMRGGPKKKPNPSGRANIYAAHGSFMILGRGFFEAGGNLAHAPFLFGEEFTIAEQARRMGKPVVYLPELRIGHAEHVSTSRLPSRVHHRFVRESVRFVADAYFSGEAAGQLGDKR